ncbi:MAG: VWA domain-containing protein [Pirellulaceae bacterium]
MTLLNGVAMFAVITVIVPIIVHLRKRRKSTVVDWPAMQFLTKTVTIRRRGVTLENLLLLLLRCLLVLLFVLAMARPTIESSRYLSWLIFFLLAGSGLLLLTFAIVSNSQRNNRIIGIAIATVLFLVAGATLTLGTESLADTEVDRDIVLVIDNSLTMTLGDDTTTHFDEAIAQSRTLVESLAGNSTVSIVLAGPIAETIAGSPFRNLRQADEVLGSLAPVAGGSNLDAAIKQARSILKRAPNTRKQILLLTDNQLCTWESVDPYQLTEKSQDTDVVADEPNSGSGRLDASEVDNIVASEADSSDDIAYAAIVARLPEKITNLSVNRLQIKTPFVTASQSVPIEVEVRNGGSTTVRNVVVKLLVDGKEAASEALIQIESGATSTARFLYAFPKSGQHVVSGTIEISDQLSEDNRFDSIVDVISHMRILVVDGSTDSDPTQHSATFAQLALDPTSIREPTNSDDIDNVDRDNLADGNSNRAIITTEISAVHLNEIESLADFQMVMLCDVPRLPVDLAARLARFVDEGGGLWIIPDAQADTTFYNNWRVPLTDEPIMPAQFGERTQWSSTTLQDGRATKLGVALDVAGRPFISELFEQGSHDLADVSLSQFWTMNPFEQAIVDMRLTNGEILFVERALGLGRVLMQGVSFSRRDSTFPSTLAFPVLMHLWTCHLAKSNAVASNIEPSVDRVTHFPALKELDASVGTLQLSEPSGTKREVPIAWEHDTPFARIGRAVIPGVYHLSRTETSVPVASFAVERAPNESDLSPVSEERLNEIGRELNVQLINDVSQLAAPAASESVGAEIWDLLLYVVLWLLAGECLVTKWIRSRRMVTEIATSLHNESHDLRSFVSPMKSAKRSSPIWKRVQRDESTSVPVSGGVR